MGGDAPHGHTYDLSEETRYKKALTIGFGDDNIAKDPLIRKKISEARKGYKFSDEAKRNMSIAKRKERRTKESREKYSKLMNEFYATERGIKFKKRLSEMRKGISPSNKIYLKCIELNKIFDGVKNAQKEVGCYNTLKGEFLSYDKPLVVYSRKLGRNLTFLKVQCEK